MKINSINNTNYKQNFDGIRIQKCSEWPEELLNAVKNEVVKKDSDSFLHASISPHQNFDLRLNYEKDKKGIQNVYVWFNDFMTTFSAKNDLINNIKATDKLFAMLKNTTVDDIIGRMTKKG